MTDDNSNHLSRLLRGWLAGGLSNAITSAILNPMDVAKTRLQVERRVLQDISGTMNHLNLRSILKQLYSENGVVGLWTPGLFPSVLREMLSSGVRAGLYVPVRDLINNIIFDKTENNDKIESLPCKIIAAMVTGSVGSIFSNPVDLIKIRLMVDPNMYPSTLSAFAIIHEKEGFSAFFKGVLPSTLRGAFIAAGELATYDHSKAMLKTQFLIPEGYQLHLFASLITGIVATTVAAPFDMIKTRAMHAMSRDGSSMMSVFKEIVKEGPFALFRGWLPSYLRLGPHAFICFPIFEQLRHMLGLDYI